MSKIIAVIMAKNEAHVIQRCLESVSWCDGIYVADTGSTDDTPGVALEAVGELGVTLLVEHHDWVDFAHNRTAAFRGAEAAFELTRDDWLLMVDADDVIVGEFTGQVPAARSNVDAVKITVRHGGIEYLRPHIFRADGLWRWRCPVHEFATRPGIAFVTSPGVANFEDCPGLSYQVLGGGARSQDPDKYRRDAELIERTLADLSPEDEDLRPRLQFYLGQSWKDAGETEKAIEALENRLANKDGYWQERYMAAIYLIGLKDDWWWKVGLAQRAVTIDYRRPEGWLWSAKAIVDRRQGCDKDERRGGLLCALPWAHYAAPRPPAMPDALFYDPRTIEWARNLQAEIEAML